MNLLTYAKLALKSANVWRKYKTNREHQVRFDALPEEQKRVVIALIQAYDDAVYLSARMSMSQRRQEIVRDVYAIAGFYLDEFHPKIGDMK